MDIFLVYTIVLNLDVILQSLHELSKHLFHYNFMNYILRKL
jgi:hypothetical protein